MSATKSNRRRWLRLAITWGVTVAVIVFIASRYSPTEIAKAVARGNWPPLIGWVAGASLYSLTMMSLADWFVFATALQSDEKPLRYRDVLRAKAGSSVLMAINHSVGQGAYGVWLARKTDSGIRETIGVMGYVIMSDLTALFAVASIGVWIADPNAIANADLIRWGAGAAAIGLVVAAFIGPRLLPRFVPQARLLIGWLKIPPHVFLINVAIRAVALLGGMIVTWAAAKSFGLNLPLAACLTYLPVIFLAGALPINVFGFGAVTLVWVAFFKAYAPAEQILAFQFLFQFMVVAAFILRGLPFLSSVTREIAHEDQLASEPDA